MATPEPLPTPARAHLEMMGAVLAGEGLARVEELVARHVGAEVRVVVPRLDQLEAGLAQHEYVAARIYGHARASRPPEVTADVPIVSAGVEVGAVLMLGGGRGDAEEYLHMAAAAALAELAVAEAREDTERALGGSLLEQLRERTDLDPGDVARRARRLGCDLSGGVVALCADPGERGPGALLATIAGDCPGSLAQAIDGRVYALLPVAEGVARRLASRLGRTALVGVSSRHSHSGGAARALEEAELIVDVTASGGGPTSDQVGDGVYRLLFRALASHPEDVRSFYEETLAPLVRHDEQYATDLVATVEAYLANDCNMNATAQSIYAHRHTISYRLERVRELTGLDPLTSQDRERLGLGLKAYRLIEPRLPR